MFDKNDGNLDASIETILNLQNDDEEEKSTEETPGSSLAEDPIQVEQPQPIVQEVDKKTQELIDEMLAAEQQAMYEEEEEEIERQKE